MNGTKLPEKNLSKNLPRYAERDKGSYGQRYGRPSRRSFARGDPEVPVMVELAIARVKLGRYGPVSQRYSCPVSAESGIRALRDAQMPGRTCVSEGK